MIHISRLCKTYKAGETEVKALKDITLDIEQGEFLSLAGPSGSGKTTLLNLIGCIDTANSGTIKVNGKFVSRKNKTELALFRRKELGFIFQSFNLIPVLTAFENVAFPLSLLGTDGKEAEIRTMAILKEVGLEGMEDRQPGKLSGGQQQRVAVARALVKTPSIILADEPTANLDSGTGKAILELMREMNRKYSATFIFSTHDPMVMDYASRIVRLHDGRIEEDLVKNAGARKKAEGNKP